jgi:hypothetical protein
MPGAVPRCFAALPDAMTAAVFLVAWIAPAVVGPDYVNRLMLTMLMEFVVMHSSGFYAGIAAADGIARGRRLAMLSGLSAIYLLFIVGFALAFHSGWPIFAFAWLFGSRFLHIWTQPSQGARETAWMFKLWVLSGVTYVLGAWLTAIIPLPRFGMTPQFVASLHLSGSGVWIDRPYCVLAFGMLYFAVQAWAKYLMSGRAADAPETPLESRMRDISNLISRAGHDAGKP